VRPELLNLVPALIAAGVVVLAVALATKDRRGMPAAAAGLTVAGLLALPTYALSVFFLQGPLHVATALWCLGAMALLHPPHSRWRWAAAVVLLAAAADGDLQALAFGVAPVAAGGALAMARLRDWRAGAAAASAAAASVVLALAVREVAKLVGTFVVNKSDPIATHAQMVTNLWLAVDYSAKMLGFGHNGFGSGGVPDPLAAVHVVGVAFVAAGVIVALVDLVRGVAGGAPRGRAGTAAWRLDDMLVVAFFADLAVFVILTSATNVSYARYLTAAVIFGSVLAGRLAGRTAGALATRGWLTKASIPCLAILACFAAGTGFNLSRAPAVNRAARLGTYLLAHDLRHGIGDYWSASVVTVETEGKVEVRPVSAPAGRVVIYTRNSEGAWYAGRSFQFLVYDVASPVVSVDAAAATATFGTPSESSLVDGYMVLVWRHPIKVGGGAS
jgi:hypothetical protein